MSASSAFLERTHILLDTCFLIKAYQYHDMPYFDNLFYYLKDNNCVPVINQFIEFEFMRDYKTQGQITIKRNYLKDISLMSLPSDKEILENALKISNIYSNKNVDPKQISFVDRCNSAFLKKYNKNLRLITVDNSDYPLIIHDRFHIETIDTDKEIIVLGFYGINDHKYKVCENDLSKT